VARKEGGEREKNRKNNFQRSFSLSVTSSSSSTLPFLLLLLPSLHFSRKENSIHPIMKKILDFVDKVQMDVKFSGI